MRQFSFEFAKRRATRLAAIGVLAGGLAASGNAAAVVTKVYWTDRDNATLSVVDLGSGASQVLVAQGFSRLQDVDLDPSTGILYFADWGPVGLPGGQGSINRVNTDGTGLLTVLGTKDAVHQLALDPALQRIYFTRAVSYDDHEISHVDTTGLNYMVLLSGGFGGPGWFPSGLAVDVPNNRLYWGDIGVIPNPPNGSVNSMTTAGASPTQLTPHVDGRGRGFALDGASQTIFLTAHDPASPATGGELFSYDIATNTETLLISDLNTGYWDIEIDPSTQRIWWTDYAGGRILSAKFDGSDMQVEVSGLTNPYGLALEIVTDSDGDGVNDDADLCPDTQIPESVPTVTLNPNNFALVDADEKFDTVTKGKGKGPGRSYTTTDTAGCSCEQIVATCGYGSGHTKHGCSISVMDWWTGLFERAGKNPYQCKAD